MFQLIQHSNIQKLQQILDFYQNKFSTQHKKYYHAFQTDAKTFSSKKLKIEKFLNFYRVENKLNFSCLTQSHAEQFSSSAMKIHNILFYLVTLKFQNYVKKVLIF